MVSDERDKPAGKLERPILDRPGLVVFGVHRAMGWAESCDHVGVRKGECDERLIVSRIVRFSSLGVKCVAFVHGTGSGDLVIGWNACGDKTGQLANKPRSVVASACLWHRDLLTGTQTQLHHLTFLRP